MVKFLEIQNLQEGQERMAALMSLLKQEAKADLSLSRHRQAHADDGTLGCRVGNLPRLPVEGSNRRRVDYAAPLTVGVGRACGHALRRQAGDVERARHVHLEDALKRSERVRVALAAHGLGRMEDASGVDSRSHGLTKAALRCQQSRKGGSW